MVDDGETVVSEEEEDTRGISFSLKYVFCQPFNLNL